METAFTPLASLGGGALIGAAAVLLMAGLGRIMGATGILAGALAPMSLSDWAWRAAVLAGMVSGPAVWGLVTGSYLEIQVPVGTGALVIGGLLIGVGVTLASGCTSGHGVCGLARLSRRSLVAVLTFMAASAATVFVLRHGLGS